MVTSPGGTSAEALAALERGRFRTVLSDEVWAAYHRTRQLEAALQQGESPKPPQAKVGVQPTGASCPWRDRRRSRALMPWRARITLRSRTARRASPRRTRQSAMNFSACSRESSR